MLPFFEVAHLPSSSSFYSAILQPLGLRYVSDPDSERSSSSGGPCITYGIAAPPTPVFQLRQASHPKQSRIVLTAPSATAVTNFHRYALRANPDLVSSVGVGAAGTGAHPGRHQQTSTALIPVGGAEPDETQESCAKVTDFDGNTMEVRYRPLAPDHRSQYGGSPAVRKTQCTTAEANRILNWDYGVAVSSPPSTIRSRPQQMSRYAEDDEPYKGLRRAVTSSVIYDTNASPRQNSSGVSTSTVVGALLGVAAGAAAGAAITYSMVKNDQARAPRQEFDPPAFSRRSTFPDVPYATDRSPRYVEVERSYEKVRYPHNYPPVADARRSPPEYIARYSQFGSAKGGNREVEDLYDDSRSRHSSRQSRSGGSVRTRSEAATGRRPLLLTETEHRSYVGSSPSRHGNAPPITRSAVHRSNTYDVSDRESYASARSQRSHSTIRPPPPPVGASAPSQLLARSRAGSRVTTTTIKMGGHGSQAMSHPPLSRAPSFMSARNVPLPQSVAGGSHVDWDQDEDSDSVVPDDSISCVGSRRSGRSYYG